MLHSAVSCSHQKHAGSSVLFWDLLILCCEKSCSQEDHVRAAICFLKREQSTEEHNHDSQHKVGFESSGHSIGQVSSVFPSSAGVLASTEWCVKLKNLSKNLLINL